MSRSSAIRAILAAAAIITAAACASPTAPTSGTRAATKRLNDGNTFTDSSMASCFSGFSVSNSGC